MMNVVFVSELTFLIELSNKILNGKEMFFLKYSILIGMFAKDLLRKNIKIVSLPRAIRVIRGFSF
jgi:hypothetical protein